MSVHELALQRNKYKHLSDDEWRWFLQQVEGRERTADKLPTFAAIDDWWYPVRLSCEQCSSELTAKYKSKIINPKSEIINGQFLDLTGGYGVDTFFLSEHFAHTDYVEQDPELCRIAEHNFANRPISIHHTTAEEFLTSLPFREGSGLGSFDLIFLDPARRDSHGGKVFRLEDCTPNVVELLPTLLQHLTPDGRIMLKLSPMLDITQAIIHLTPYTLHLSWDIYVVAIKNEVKELLLVSGGTGQITAIDLAEPEKAFVFTREEECEASSLPFQGELEGAYLYEPNAAILKSGAYKLVAQRFGLHKLDVNTHLYASNKLVEDFPGRTFKALPFTGEELCSIERPVDGRRTMTGVGSQANVLTRNYPLTAEQLKKKLHLRDGGERFIIGCRVNGKPVLFEAERV